jgi:hypothetical protein
VLGKAHGEGRERRQPHRAAVRRLDAATERLVLAQEVLGVVRAVHAQAPLVAQPRIEAGAVRHAVGRGGGDRSTLRLVLLDLRQLLNDARLLRLPLRRRLALSEVEGAVAERLRELALGATGGHPLRPVVSGAARPVERLVGLGDARPLEWVAASVRMVEQRLLLVAVPDLLHRGGGWHA